MPSFKALMTAIYPTADLARAKAWYAEAFGVAPYFDEPFYVGFNVSGYELGLMPVEPPLHEPGNRGVVAYWGVDDAAAAHARLLTLGATELGAVQDVGGGIKVSMVADPDGNALGVIENPHFGAKSA
jgi:predicted enzyme related to lactoylglutathione lyase